MNESDRIAQLEYDLQVARMALDGRVLESMSWLQMKVASQRRALDALNRKVLSQRFRLRILNELGRDLTQQEYESAKAAIENEQVQDRIADYQPLEAAMR